MAFNQSWDETSPTDSDYGYQIDDFIRNLKEAIRERLAVEHAFYSDETGHSDVGEHKKGSARINFGAAADIPSNNSDNPGAVYAETDDKNIKFDDGSSWVNINGYIDHGSIKGLTDDDHTQYLTTGRHDTTTRHPVSVLKKTTGSTSFSINDETLEKNVFTVNAYAFGDPEVKWESDLVHGKIVITMGLYTDPGTAYVRKWTQEAYNDHHVSKYAYTRWRYLQSSPPYEIEHFFYFLVNPDGSIKGGWEAEDPPWKGQGFDGEATEEDLPHPFLSKKEDQKVILVNPSMELITELRKIKKKLKKGFLEFLNEGHFVISDRIDKPRGAVTEKIIAKGIEFRPLAKGKPIKV